MKAVEINWTETSQHRATVLVPDDVDPDVLVENYDLENALGQLDDDGFCGLVRDINSVEPSENDVERDEYDAYQELDLTGYALHTTTGGPDGDQEDPDHPTQMG